MGEREEDWNRIQSPRERSIRRATREGRLVPARDLIHELNLIVHLDTAVMVELIGGQYQLAERRGINGWIRDLHYQGTFLMPLRELQWYFPKLETYPRRESQEGGKDRRRETHPRRESQEGGKNRQRETCPRRESQEGGKDRQRETCPRRESREEEKGKENPGPTELQKSKTKPQGRSQDRRSHSHTETVSQGTEMLVQDREVQAGKQEMERPKSPGGRRIQGSKRSIATQTANDSGPPEPAPKRLKNAEKGLQIQLSGEKRVVKDQRRIAHSKSEGNRQRRKPETGRPKAGGCRDLSAKPGPQRTAQEAPRGRKDKAAKPQLEGSDHQNKGRPRKTRYSVCPYPGCKVSGRRIKRHVMGTHLPEVFHDRQPEETSQDSSFLDQRLEGLEILARAILGRPSVRALARWVDRTMPEEAPLWTILSDTKRDMYRLSRRARWRLPDDFTLSPLSSPAILIHWRIMARLMGRVSRRVREEMFMKFGIKSTRTQEPSDHKESCGQPEGATSSRTEQELDVMECGQPSGAAPVGESDRPADPQEVCGQPEGDAPSRIEEKETALTENGQPIGAVSLVVVEQDKEEPMEVEISGETEMGPKPDTPSQEETRQPSMPRVLKDGVETTISSLSQMEEEKGKLKLILTPPKGASVELDYEESPNSRVSEPISTTVEAELLRSDTESSPARQTFAEVVKGTKVGVVVPRKSQPLQKFPHQDIGLTDSSLPMAFDSHFHVDRLAATVGGSALDIERLVQQITEVAPVNRTILSGGVLVYCDPKTYDKVPLQAQPKWRVAVGIHPKKVKEFTAEKQRYFNTLHKNPRVGALGEVGLDYSDPNLNREDQKRLLTQVVKSCTPEKVLILHVRGTRGDHLSAEASRDCLAIVQEACDPEQRVHLHCFGGGVQQLREWRRAFPDCHFGVTGKVVHFNREQREALCKIPLDRLLVETDAPYMPMLHGLRTTSPAYIGDVAAAVSRVRGDSIDAILLATEANGRRLYRQ